MLKYLPELLDSNVIDASTAKRIEEYYASKKQPATNRLFVAFGILGALLVGLGIILIIAHNWDQLSRATRLALSVLPLVASQVVCAYVYFRRPANVVWKESCSVLLFFSVGASISLISQVYHISGDLPLFIRTWMLLCLPVVYLMRSAGTSLLYILGITFYGCASGNWTFHAVEYSIFWFMLAAVLPFYYRLCTQASKSNFTHFHNWVVPLSVAIVLGRLAKSEEEFLFISYCSLFAVFHFIGNLTVFRDRYTSANPYRLIGETGTIILLLIVSSGTFWNNLYNESISLEQMLRAREFYCAALVTIAALLLFLLEFRKRPTPKVQLADITFLIFFVLFFAGLITPVAGYLVNLLVLAIGLLKIRDGVNRQDLKTLNFGLVVISALVYCRFVDSELSFVTKGLLFVGTGLCFFLANYQMLRLRRKNEQ
jgi:uncharacterized membrane protein